MTKGGIGESSQEEGCEAEGTRTQEGREAEGTRTQEGCEEKGTGQEEAVVTSRPGEGPRVGPSPRWVSGISQVADGFEALAVGDADRSAMLGGRVGYPPPEPLHLLGVGLVVDAHR